MSQEKKVNEKTSRVPKLKIVLAEISPFRDAIAVIKEFVSEANFRVDKDDIEIIEQDPANVALVNWKFFSSNCVEFDCTKGKFGLNLNSLYTVLKNGKPNDMLVIENSEEANKIDIVFKGNSVRRYTLPIIDVETDIKIPNLVTSAKIRIYSKRFQEQIKEVAQIAESVAFDLKGKQFNLLAGTDLSKLKIENKEDDDTRIDSDKGDVHARYTIAYLKNIVKASKIAEEVTIEYGKDYPSVFTYTCIDRQQLKFILAPRIEN